MHQGSTPANAKPRGTMVKQGLIFNEKAPLSRPFFRNINHFGLRVVRI
jgi:hypothetical protein